MELLLPADVTIADVAHLRVDHNWVARGYDIYAYSQLHESNSGRLIIPRRGSRTEVRWERAYRIRLRNRRVSDFATEHLPRVLAELVAAFGDDPLDDDWYPVATAPFVAAGSTTIRFTQGPTAKLRKAMWGLSDPAAVGPSNPFGLVHAPAGARFGTAGGDADPVKYYVIDKLVRGMPVPAMPIYTHTFSQEHMPRALAGVGGCDTHLGWDTNYRVGLNDAKVARVNVTGADSLRLLRGVMFEDVKNAADGNEEWGVSQSYPGHPHGPTYRFSIPAWGDIIEGAYISLGPGRDIYNAVENVSLSICGTEYCVVSGKGLRLLHELDDVGVDAAQHGCFKVPMPRAFSVSMPYGNRFIMLTLKDSDVPTPIMYTAWRFIDPTTHDPAITPGIKYTMDTYREVAIEATETGPLTIHMPRECKHALRAVVVSSGGRIWTERPAESITIDVAVAGPVHVLGVRSCPIYSNGVCVWMCPLTAWCPKKIKKEIRQYRSA